MQAESTIVRAKDPMVPRLYNILRVQKETHDTFTLAIQPLDGAKNHAFRPGQFNMLYVFGAGEVPISISGDPADLYTLAHTTRATGTVTQAMSKLKRGDTLGVRGPFGSDWPIKAATGKDVVIVAGGIGLAPLRPALYEIVANRSRYGKVVLLYGARDPSELLYKRELAEWRAQLDLEVHVTVDRAVGSWRGNVGFVTTLIPRAPFDPLNAVALVCGPELMMRFSVLELQRRGLASPNTYISMERNVKCGVGVCGHCQFGPNFICKDGPVFSFEQVEPIFGKREV